MMVTRLAVLSLMVTFSSQSGVIENAGRTIKREIIDAKKPVDKVLINAFDHVSSKCSKVKKLAGVYYESVMGASEPDLDQLKLHFYSGKVHLSFKLGEAARVLPEAAGYNKSHKLVIFLHGFTDDPSLLNFLIIKEAFSGIEEVNLLALDASSLIRYMYLRSSTYVRLIGARLGETLAAMHEVGLDRKDIHLVGHSLGAHIAGFAGKSYRSLSGGAVGRVSGLDPAGPCFSHVEPDLKLQRDDADFVDVIHSNAGVFGLNETVGHVDFYPNGGSQQAGCLTQVCDHSRVVELFAESVQDPLAFPARACLDWGEFQEEKCSGDISMMGYHTEPKTRGSYYLRTGPERPYALGEEGLVSESGGVVRTLRSIKQQLVDLMI